MGSTGCLRPACCLQQKCAPPPPHMAMPMGPGLHAACGDRQLPGCALPLHHFGGEWPPGAGGVSLALCTPCPPGPRALRPGGYSPASSCSGGWRGPGVTRRRGPRTLHAEGTQRRHRWMGHRGPHCPQYPNAQGPPRAQDTALVPGPPGGQDPPMPRTHPCPPSRRGAAPRAGSEPGKGRPRGAASPVPGTGPTHRAGSPQGGRRAPHPGRAAPGWGWWGGAGAAGPGPPPPVPSTEFRLLRGRARRPAPPAAPEPVHSIGLCAPGLAPAPSPTS